MPRMALPVTKKVLLYFRSQNQGPQPLKQSFTHFHQTYLPTKKGGGEEKKKIQAVSSQNGACVSPELIVGRAFVDSMTAKIQSWGNLLYSITFISKYLSYSPTRVSLWITWTQQEILLKAYIPGHKSETACLLVITVQSIYFIRNAIKDKHMSKITRDFTTKPINSLKSPSGCISLRSQHGCIKYTYALLELCSKQNSKSSITLALIDI